MTLDRLWAGWRRTYVESVTVAPGAGAAPGAPGVTVGPQAGLDTGADGAFDGPAGCVFCAILASTDDPAKTFVVWRSDLVAVLLNAYPYTSGHLLTMPVRHVAELGDLSPEESAALWSATVAAIEAVTAAYRPDGINMGANLGAAAGAGIPGHLHLHCLPRWAADTNFMTSVAETRVLPESLDSTYAKVAAAWPGRENQ